MSVPAVQVSAEVLQLLAPEAARLGISLPTTARFAPEINVTKNIRALAWELGQLLKLRNIFLRSGTVVTVDEDTGEIKPMTAKRLPGWAEEFCTFIAPGARRVRDSLNTDDAAQLLETDVFLAHLRPLAAVHTIILPVMRPVKEGQERGDVEWLPLGYDEQSQIYTVDVIKYDMDWPVGKSQQWFLDVCGQFPWNETEDSRKFGLGLNRSLSLHVMANVGQYCRAMFPPGSLYPIIAYFANKPGTGKTRLMEMAVTAVHGFAAATGAPKDEEKMEVKLETAARSMQPFMLLDDIGGGLRSNTLNRWTTESWHMGRPFHSNSEMFRVPNVTQVFVTANDLKTSEDIHRRALIVELFLDSEVKGRKFTRTITPQWLSADDTRASFLSACCAMVKHWIAKGRPLHQAPLETYEEWTMVLGGIVTACEWADPLAAPEGVVGGAVDEDEIKQLLVAIANEKLGDCVIKRSELIDSARAHGLLEDLVGTEGDVDQGTLKKIGRRLQRWRGQKLKDEKGRLFEFSHKRQKSGATYPLTFAGGGKAVVTPPELSIDDEPEAVDVDQGEGPDDSGHDPMWDHAGEPGDE